MPSCHYIAKDDPSKSMPAKHFGYWSLRWSDESARGAISQLQVAPFSGIAGVQVALKRSFELKLFLIALHAGAHWAFAAAIPSIFGGLKTEDFTQTLTDLKAGCEDATKELCLPNGAAVPEQVSRFASGQTGEFFKHILGDLSDDATRSREALAPIPRRAGAHLLSLLEGNFKTSFRPEETLVVGQLFDLFARSTVDALDQLFSVSLSK